MMELDSVVEATEFDDANFTGPLTLLPDPGPREVWCPVISVDDHAFEPSTLFDRVPARFRDVVPRMVEHDGHPVWQIGDRHFPLLGIDGAAGRPIEQVHASAMHLEQYRRGVWDIHARVQDMDLNGVWASLNFPSIVWGFAGTTLNKLPDKDVALACVQAYNDWMVEEWCGAYPERFIPCQLPYLVDPVVAAQEIRRNAARGVHSVSFSENPHGLGYPSIHGGHWDPFLQACEETGTVLNLHVGSSGKISQPSPDSPTLSMSALFPINGIEALVDWVLSKVTMRFPDLKIVLSEAGISWVPMVIERLTVASRRRRETTYWAPSDPDPVDLLRRNFWFTSIEDPSGFRALDIIGEDKVMVEVDYPHPDGTWPQSQETFRGQLEGLPVETIRKLCYQNAADLYQHPAPPDALVKSSTHAESGTS